MEKQKVTSALRDFLLTLTIEKSYNSIEYVANSVKVTKEHEAHFCSKFKNKLRTIPASAEEQNLAFLIKIMNKTAASATQLAKCIFASCLFMYNCQPPAVQAQIKTSYSLFNKLT